ncbi:MAG TPA: ABC transporter substrate-binding protein [Vicinamibacterales bacterium]|nr:ABC transporter substrate-binding protein [Vicinamibacterales bacterium]
MKPRITTLATVLAVLLLAAALAAGAQQTGKVRQLGFLSSGSPGPSAPAVEAFVGGLREHGWVDGQNLAIEYRWAGTGAKPLHELAAELSRLPVEVIYVRTTPAALALKKTGTKIPVVFSEVSEPVTIGLVASFARPGGSFTGIASINREIMPKRLALLKEAIGDLTRVGYIANPAYALYPVQSKEMREAARALGMELLVFEASTLPEVERAFAGMVERKVGAYIVQQGPPFLFSFPQQIVDLGARARLPGMFAASAWARRGGLMAYGAVQADYHRRAADYVDKILRGTNPADLPVEQPTTFDLVINLKTARSLGLTIPQSLLLWADHVIE